MTEEITPRQQEEADHATRAVGFVVTADHPAMRYVTPEEMGKWPSETLSNLKIIRVKQPWRFPPDESEVVIQSDPDNLTNEEP